MLVNIPKNKNNIKTESYSLDHFSKIPEELIWRANFTSNHSIETYDKAIQQFMAHCNFSKLEDLRLTQVIHIISYRDYLLELGKKHRTINNRLSALSSLFQHLLSKQIVTNNPVKGVKRLRVNHNRVESKALTKIEVRNILDSPNVSTKKGLRDRALLGVLFFTGCRIGEVRKLKIRDYYEEQGYSVLDFQLKGGKQNAVAIHQELQVYLNRYIKKMGHWNEKEAPLFLPGVCQHICRFFCSFSWCD